MQCRQAFSRICIHRIISLVKELPLRRPETNMRCLLTSWDRCGVKIAIILEQTYWWTITGAASSLRSQTTILCRQSSWILRTSENLPHPGFTLVWRPFLFFFSSGFLHIWRYERICPHQAKARLIRLVSSEKVSHYWFLALYLPCNCL